MNRRKLSKKKGKLFILSGPSGAGKTTLHKKILQKRKYKRKLVKIISVTTRPPRKKEKNGYDYFFISEKMFKYKAKAGHFLEYMKVFDHFYGTPKKQVEDILKKGKSVLLCIDVKGADIVCQKKKEAITIFVDVVSFGELKKRLLLRGSEDRRTISKRLKIAREERKKKNKYKHIVINDDLKKAVKQLDFIISKEIGGFSEYKNKY